MKEATLKEVTDGRATIPTSIRLTPQADFLWLEIGTRLGLNKKGVLETLLREKGKQVGIDIPAERTGSDRAIILQGVSDMSTQDSSQDSSEQDNALLYLSSHGSPELASFTPDQITRVFRRIIGRRLEEERRRRGFSQRPVAEYLGLSREQVSQVELGKREFYASYLVRLADLFERPMGWFFQIKPGDASLLGNDDAAILATYERTVRRWGRVSGPDGDEKILTGDALRDDQRQLLADYEALGDEQRDALAAIARALLRVQGKFEGRAGVRDAVREGLGAARPEGAEI